MRPRRQLDPVLQIDAVQQGVPVRDGRDHVADELTQETGLPGPASPGQERVAPGWDRDHAAVQDVAEP